jgi:DNA primase small subunit
MGGNTRPAPTKDEEQQEENEESIIWMEQDIIISNDDRDHVPEKEGITNPTPVQSPTPITTSSSSSSHSAAAATPTAVTPYHHHHHHHHHHTPPPPPLLRTTSTTTTTTTNKNHSKEEPAVTTPLLSLYYQHLFPYDFIYQWFRYGTGPASRSSSSQHSNNNNNNTSMNLFLHREFSFTIKNAHTDDEIYLRYQSFSHPSDFQAAIQKRIPIKIDIGAIFTHPPIQKHTFATSSSFQPLEREFVLDIDLTDYDDIRNCGCQNANICPICWKYMYMAMDTINTVLYDDFQFQYIQWFYSGRRGIHGWVCDTNAKTLTDPGRTAIANYLTVRIII